MNEQPHNEETSAADTLRKARKMIESDPKKYLRDSKDPEHLLNSKNLKRQTLLYIACKNGNFEVLLTQLKY